jgi:hypothetical protein
VLLLPVPTLLLSEPRRFPPPVPFVFAVGLPVGAVVLGHLRQWQTPMFQGAKHGGEIAAICILVTGMLLVIRSYRTVRSRGDRSHGFLKPFRVRSALAWGLATTLLLTYLASVSWRELAPMWSAWAGSILGWGVETLANLRHRSPVEGNDGAS